jgi:predicted MPP superfamily phosphohydrolase
MEIDPATVPITPQNPPVTSRRRFFGQLLAAAALPVSAGIYSYNIEPFWPRFHEFSIAIKGLPKSFENFRIAQITDMHTGHTPFEYLQEVVNRTAALKPDLVVFTGDLIHHASDWIDKVAELVKTFAPHVLVSLGNHDYGPWRGDTEPNDPLLAEKLTAALTAIGATVLVNKAKPIEHPDGRLWFAGLDDLWYGDFRPDIAFAHVPANEPVIALSHNPDTAEMLAPHHPDLILSGHTHGGQIRLPFYGALRLNVAQPQYDWGHFQLPGSQLYVSSGVGYIKRVRFNCRPEVPVFRLISATA